MRWPTAVIASMVIDAGWRGDDAVTATALVMAVSGGDDMFLEPSFAAAVPSFVGLFGVPVDASNISAQVALMSPKANVARARELWDADDLHWSWCLVDAADALVQWGAVAAEAVAAPRRGITELEATVDQSIAGMQDAVNAASRAALSTIINFN